MIKTKNQNTAIDVPLNLTPESSQHPPRTNEENPHAPNHSQLQVSTANSKLLVLNRNMGHTPHAGLNPLVDAASLLFSLLGKIKNLTSYRHINKLQEELILEVNSFQESVKNQGYNLEYIVVCRYVLCATFDDIISNLTFGGHWHEHSLLAAFNQDLQHQDKFYTIMERAIKEPAIYIDLMELMYICLSMGYKGQYRATEHSQYQLEQITNNLYQHIQAYRGGFSKTLSPLPRKTKKTPTKVTPKKKVSILFICIVTACAIMTIFVSLGYLMDVISNEAYSNISAIKFVSHEAH
jgi:type VI secretion system protein ImpK